MHVGMSQAGHSIGVPADQRGGWHDGTSAEVVPVVTKQPRTGWPVHLSQASVNLGRMPLSSRSRFVSFAWPVRWLAWFGVRLGEQLVQRSRVLERENVEA